MSYVLTGRLQARCDAEVVEPIANQTVLLYWVPDGEQADFEVRTHEAARGREYLLLAQGRTDENGEYRIDITGNTLLGHRGSTRRYEGGPLGFEIYQRGVGHDAEPTQFTIGHVQPEWQGTGEEHTARFDHELSAEQWKQVRQALDAWTIVGFVEGKDGSPAAGYRVLAYDADTLHDDFLGSADVAADGSFRIDYAGSTFRPAAVAGVDVERGGPEIYFHVQAPDGSVVFEEPSSRGTRPDRANASNWFTTRISLDRLPDVSPRISTTQ